MFMFFSLIFTGMHANWIRRKIIKLNAVPGKEQEIARLTEKHTQLYSKYMGGYAKYIRPRSLKSELRVARNRMFAFMCLWILVIITLIVWKMEH